jgi:type I restriction enzyme M protein
LDIKETVQRAEHIAANFVDYIEGFCLQIRTMQLSKKSGLNFGAEIEKMDGNNRLYGMVESLASLTSTPTR